MVDFSQMLASVLCNSKVQIYDYEVKLARLKRKLLQRNPEIVFVVEKEIGEIKISEIETEKGVVSISEFKQELQNFKKMIRRRR